MATPGIATSPFPAAPAEAAQLRMLLARDVERTLTNDDNAFPPPRPLGEIVDLSGGARLLSSVDLISNAAASAQSGEAADSLSIVDAAQRFVDNVNALSLESAAESEGVFLPGLADEVAIALATSANERLGINILAATPTVPVQLTLDREVLAETAATDSVGASRQLATLAVPLGSALAAQASTPPVYAPLPAPPPLPSEQGLAEAGEDQAGSNSPSLDLSSNTSDEITSDEISDQIAPDLAEANAQLQRTLADTALSESLNEASLSAAALSPPTVAAPAEIVSASPPRSGVGVFSGASSLNLAETLSRSPTRLTAAEIAPPTAELLATSAAVPLDPGPDSSVIDRLLNPLRHSVQLAGNPTVAGAVAAFQISGDEGGRNGKVGLVSDFEFVSPVAGILADEPVGANLRNGSEQRQGRSDPRQSAWLGTRPDLY